MSTLILDVGQTGVRGRVDVGGQPGEPFSRPGIRGDQDIMSQVAQIVSSELTRDGAIDEARIGLTGLEPDQRPANLLAADWRLHGLRRVLVAHDSVTAALGALGLGQGVVLAVGTGIVGIGVGPDRVARVDGWGSILDDAGSAHWIGLAGLRAAVRSADGRGEATTLQEAARERFGPLGGLGGLIQRMPDRVSRIAAFAREVTSRADTDATADLICESAVSEYLRTVDAAIVSSKLNDVSDPVQVTWSGSVLTASATLRHRLADRLPESTQLVTPLATPLDGVALLAEATTSSTHPLAALIDISTITPE